MSVIVGFNEVVGIRSHAKLNLILWVGGLRSDGYHDVATLSVKLELADELYIKSRRKKEGYLYLKVEGAEIPLEDNLLYKLYRSLLDRYPSKVSGRAFEVFLRKNVPLKAGLGGGSSDLYSFARYLAEQLKLDGLEMEGLLSRLSSDSLLFKHDIALGLGRGNEVYPLSEELASILRRRLKKYWLLMVYPTLKVSTKEAYSWLDDMRAKGNMPLREELVELSKEGFERLLKEILDRGDLPLENDFEKVIYRRFPSMRRLRDELMVFAEQVVLAGSGSTIVGFMDKLEDLEVARTFLRKKYKVKVAVSRFKLV